MQLWDLQLWVEGRKEAQDQDKNYDQDDLLFGEIIALTFLTFNFSCIFDTIYKVGNSNSKHINNSNSGSKSGYKSHKNILYDETFTDKYFPNILPNQIMILAQIKTTFDNKSIPTTKNYHLILSGILAKYRNNLIEANIRD